MRRDDRSRVGPEGVAAFFASLGERVRDAWQRIDHDEDRFAAIARDALAEAAVSDRLGYQDLVGWVARAAELPPQDLASGFGQPPLTLFRDERFRIDALFWRFETTAIHQHAFSGAFTVLAGSSVHCTYTFAPKQKLSSRFVIGELAPASIERLRPGAVRRIERAGRMIHSVFHLETPSVTIVIGTVGDPEVGPEYTYYPPAVALDPSDPNALRARRLQLLELLAAVDAAELERAASEIVARCDLHTTFLVLTSLASRSAALGERVLARARARHGDVVDALAPAITEERRRSRMFALRRAATDPEHRFLLALLLSMLGRAAIDDFLRVEYPGADPAALLERWILDLSRAGLLGISFDDTLARLLRGCLRGRSAGELVAQLREEHALEDDAHAAEIAEACRLLRAHPFLAPLFSPEGGAT